MHLERSPGDEPPAIRLLLTEASAARKLLITSTFLGLVVTAAILAQAGLLAHLLAGGSWSRAGALLLVVVLCRAAAAYGAEVTALRAAATAKERLRCKLVRHAMTLGPSWIGGQRAGELTTLATSGLDALDPFFGRYLPQLLLAGSVPVAVVATVTAQDWLSGLIITLTLPLIPLFAVLIGAHAKARTQRSWRLLALLGGHFLDVVQGLPTLKVFGRAKDQERVIAAVTARYRASVMSSLKIAFLSALVLELSAALATALIAVEVGLRLLYGHVGYATALLVLLLTPEAYLPLRNAAAQFHASADGITAARRVFKILGILPSQGTPGPAPPPAPAPLGAALARARDIDLCSQGIALNAVTVTYPGRPQPVIDAASLLIAPGDVITLTGPIGAGKTSLLQLLLKLIEPASGTVMVGAADLASVPEDVWRSQIGWLPQRPAMFPWTVAQNIALGAQDASRAAVERAAEAAGAAGFIARLPDGYDTVLDERAARLSAGQRQKIALARLFLRDAPLLLLDEPTTHLDPVSAADVDAAITTLMAGRTIILAAHRPTAIAEHRTVLLRDGRIIEQAVAVAR
jgi:ATP-binding cassette, subfamily C, bacterial CydD